MGMVDDVNLEREFKFDVDPDFNAPDLRPLVAGTERLPEQHLTTTYFDTADRRLWARGITLRHRVETEGDAPAGGPGKWTLKLPLPVPDDAAELDRTARSELSWKGAGDAVPEEVSRIVAGLTRRARLEPVVVLSTDRRRLLLHDGDRAWAELDDDLATVSSGARSGLRFRQLELELLGPPPSGPGADDQLDPILDGLRRAGAVPGGASKFALAAGLDDGVTRSAAGSHPADLRDFVNARLTSGLGLLLEADYRLRVPGVDPASLDAFALGRAAEAVDRLQADLWMLGAVLDPVWAKHRRADLRWLAGLVSRLHQEDALVELLRGPAGGRRAPMVDAETVHELVVFLRSDRHLGTTQLCEALSSDRYMLMLDQLQAGSGEAPLYDPGGAPPYDLPVSQALESAVAAAWRLVEIDLGEVGPNPGDEALHRVGAHARRLQHAAAAAEPHLSRRQRKAAVAAGRAASLLAELSGAETAARSLRELASHPSITANVAFAAGWAAGWCEARAQHLRKKWGKQADRLALAGHEAWPLLLRREEECGSVAGV